MKISASSVVKYAFLLFILAFNFLFLYNTIEPKLIFHVQQLSFVFSYNFLKQHLLLPGSFSEYLAELISQLFYYNFFGSLVITLIALLIFAAGFYILKQFNNKNAGFALALLPLSFLFLLLTNYYFPFSVIINVLLIYLFTGTYLYITKKNLYIFPVFAILALLVYYICGSGVFMIFVTNSIIITAYFKKLKTSSIFLFFAIILSTTIPYVAYKFIFNLNLSNAYFSILPELPNALKYNADIFLYLLFFFLPFSLIIASIISGFSSNSKKSETTKKIKPFMVFIRNWGILIVSIIIFSAINYFGIKQKFDIHRKNIALVDYYNYNEQWDEAKETILSDNQYDMYLNFYYMRTIDHLGEFVTSYFSYPQLLGGDALFPDRISSSSTSLISSDHYYDLGYITQAHHWAHEAQTGMPNSPRILRRLVMTNLIMGNYYAAKNLLSQLQKIPFNKEFTDKYLKYIDDTSLIASDNEIKEKRSLMPESGEIVSDNFDQQMYTLLENKKNKDAYNHLQMYCLTTQRLGNFIKNLELADQYYKTLPHVFEEAIVVYSLKSKQFPNNIQISKQVQNQINGISEIMSQFKGDKYAAKEQLRNSYGSTYFYYIIYNSPLVTKAELKVK